VEAISDYHPSDWGQMRRLMGYTRSFTSIFLGIALTAFVATVFMPLLCPLCKENLKMWSVHATHA